MADTITESFCERCGTRYEFKAPTRLNPLRKTRGLIGGLKNYVMSQDALGDAIGDSMRSEEDQLASAQLEAFHQSFNFCIDCRQYTCLNCWNDDAGRCRSCVPMPGTDDLAERLAAGMPGAAADAIAAPALDELEADAAIGLESWPTSDLPEVPEPALNGNPPEAWPVADGFVYESPQTAEELVRAADGFVYEGPVQVELPADVAAETELSHGIAEDKPEPVVAAEIEPEPLVAEELEPEPVVAEELEPEPVAAEEIEPVVAEELEAEPVVAEELEPEPVAAEEIEPVVAEELEPVMAEDLEPEKPRLRVVAWDEDAAYDLEPEPIVADVAFETESVVAEELEPEPVVAEEIEPEPIVAEELEPEPVVAEEIEPEPLVADELEPEPIVAEELEPEPVVGEEAAEPEPVAPRRFAPISETILRFPQRPIEPPAERKQVAAESDSPEVAARRAQLDLLGLGDPGEGPVQETRPGVLPYRSRGSGVTQGELAARAAAHGANFWEASAREVASAVGNVAVQNCGQCGLSLSANARFCRRCGTRQAQSA